MLMSFLKLVMVLLVGVTILGCSATSRKINKLQLGMTTTNVLDAAGEPFVRRAAKVYEDGRTTEIWEYVPRFSIDPRYYWVYFEDGKVVQWGEPGDFTDLAGDNVPVKEYKPTKVQQ